jgi:hypothetical protein
MLQRYIGSNNQLPEDVQIPTIFHRAALTPKQWKRALQMQNKIKSLERKLATILANPGRKS